MFRQINYNLSYLAYMYSFNSFLGSQLNYVQNLKLAFIFLFMLCEQLTLSIKLTYLALGNPDSRLVMPIGVTNKCILY